MTATVAAGAIAAVGAAGVASGALKTKRAETSLAPNTFGSVSAKCKQGTRAVSGGFDAPGTVPDSSGPRGQAYVSTRQGRRAWVATGENTGDDVAADWVALAYCSDALPKLKAKTKTTSVAEEAPGTATAKCKKGSEAVSGGFITQEADEAIDPYPFESRRVGKRKWQVSATNFGTEPVPLTAIAYCAKDKLGLKTQSASSPVSDFEVVSAEASCKKGSKAVSGGFDGEITLNFERETYPFQSMRSGGRSWSAAANGYLSTGESLTWKAFAYCIDKQELR